MQKIIDFVTEFVSRLKSKTPQFFQVLRNYSAVLTAVNVYLTSQNLEVPEFQWLDSRAALAVGIMGIILSQLAVEDREKTNLPYTNPESPKTDPEPMAL
jgi:hypothetical protein